MPARAAAFASALRAARAGGPARADSASSDPGHPAAA
jgi:hypothetical protein